jgi:integrase
MRQGEIINLTWSNVDLKRGYIILEETKNGERRSVPLVGFALEQIKALNKVRRIDTPLLFPSAVKPLVPIDIRTPWHKALQHSEVKNFRFHDLRHTAASYLAMNGASLAEIADILGHKTLQMVKRYAHLSEQHTSKVLESMNQKLFSFE